MTHTHQVIEQTVREAYSRLLAYLASRTRDVATAEDVLTEALHAALQTWPKAGVPERPEAWLMTTAKRRLLDRAKHAKVRQEAKRSLVQLTEELAQCTQEPLPDRRLQLLFVCAHPAIPASVRSPLMLQTVLGLNAEEIASAFLTSPTTMGQRLVRAKRKIKEAGIPFCVPTGAARAERAPAVLEAVYAAYSSGWEQIQGGDTRQRGLAEEAIWLARLLVQLMQKEPEAKGLLALLLHCEARRGARRDQEGMYKPLSEQDTQRWSLPLLEEAEALLREASTYQTPGRYQLEAAIQSAHAQRRYTGDIPWDGIVQLYDALVTLAPSIGALVGRAAALGEAITHSATLAALEELPTETVKRYQPFWAVRAHALRHTGALEEAAKAYQRAIGLSEDASVRRFLTNQYNMCTTPPKDPSL